MTKINLGQILATPGALEALTGELPFSNKRSLTSLITAVLTEDPPGVSELQPGIDPQLDAICRKAMAKKPEDRYESMKAFAQTLSEFLRSESSGSKSINDSKDEQDPPALTRAKEQFELARSLYAEEQYGASISILEKMASETNSQTSKYSEWAARELPKVRGKARGEFPFDESETSTPIPLVLDLGSDSNPSPGLAAHSPVENKSKRGRHPALRRPQTIAVCAVVALFLVFIATVSGSLFDKSEPEGTNDVSDAQASDLVGNIDDASPPNNRTEDVESPISDTDFEAILDSITPDVNGARGPGRFSGERPDKSGSTSERMFEQYDSNGDAKLSKTELSSPHRRLENAPARIAYENFDEYDSDPKDGFLNGEELDAALTDIFDTLGGRCGGRFRTNE